MSSALKFALILLAAAVLATGARALYVGSLNRQAAPDPDIRVRVAAADLPEGLLLRDSDLAWKALPRGQVPKDAVREDAHADVNGALLRRRLAAGDTLHGANMIRPDAPGFLAAALKPGLRAVSVPVNDVSGNAGLIQPGDYVDLILTQQLGQRGDTADTRRVASETIVRNARVIAVGSSFQRNADDSNPKPGRIRTTTIEVAPRAAEAVTVAAELGSLSLALRSFATNDRDTADDRADAGTGASVVAWGDSQATPQDGPVWGSDISRVRQPVQADGTVNPGTPRRITIMRGNEKQEQELGPHAQ
jgi:pilus assembly protein CpaB